MITYKKYCPNVYLAQCSELKNKGDIVNVTTLYGNDHECYIHNLVYEKDWYYYYSITRVDWFNNQERAKNKAEKHLSVKENLEKKSDSYYQASQEWKDFLALAEPIKIWHHSENRHRSLIERNRKRMSKSVELSNLAQERESKIKYREEQSNKIDLSIPESLEYYEYKVEKETEKNQWLKDWTIPRSHSFTLTYSTKKLKELKKQLEIAQKLRA